MISVIDDPSGNDDGTLMDQISVCLSLHKWDNFCEFGPRL